MKQININALYYTYQGEVNVRGIGAPVIFLRLQGCHLRCYKKTLGCLCDTEEALDKSIEKRMYYLDDLCDELHAMREVSGIDYICFTGGDPLYYDSEVLSELFIRLTALGFVVSVETSGTLPIAQYVNENIHWVLDYKLISTGVKSPFIPENLDQAGECYLKFVIYDDKDYNEAVKVIRGVLATKPKVIPAMGIYWGTPHFSNEKMLGKLTDDNLLGKVHVNFQTHKMATLYDACEPEQIAVVNIPKLL